MPVLFDGNSIIPAPFVDISKEVRKGEDGVTKSFVYRITLKGKLVAYKGGLTTAPGYPADQSQYMSEIDRMAGIVDKLGALAYLFRSENDGKLLEIQPPNASAPIKCQPRILGLNFPEGKWVETEEYSISMEADQLWFGDRPVENSINEIADESWQIEQSDDRAITYRFSHNISANGKRTFNTDGTVAAQGWENARTKVLAKLGIDNSIMHAAGVLDLNTFTAYNYVRSETLDEANGRFSVNETWLLFDLSSGVDPQGTTIPCIDSFNITTRIADDGRIRVNIDGTLTGLEVRNNTTRAIVSSKYSNAVAKLAILTNAVLLNRAQSFSGNTLNPTPINFTVGRNPETGVITYTKEFDDRPANLVDGALSETIQISDRLPTDVIAKVPVLNRQLGPILQPTGSKTDKSRTISIEIVVPGQKYGEAVPSKPDVTSLITLYGPNGSQGFTGTVGPYLDRNEENWQPRTGRYSRSIGWIYE